MKHFVLFLFAVSAVVSCHKEVASTASTNSIAVVAGEPVPLEAKDDLGSYILGKLLERYAFDNKLFATDEELECYHARRVVMQQDQVVEWERIRDSTKRRLASNSVHPFYKNEAEEQLSSVEGLLARSKAKADLSPEERRAVEATDLEQAKRSIRDWKVNRALFAKYGGEVTDQPNGPAPFAAYRKFLKEQKTLGMFKLLDESLEETLWNTFEDDRRGITYHNPENALALPQLTLEGVHVRP